MQQVLHRRFLVLLLLLGIVLGVLIGSGQIRCYDVWWHLRLGQDILRTGKISLYDEYSHTATGNFRPPQQWLFEVLEAGVYSLGEDSALVGLRTVLAAIALVVLGFILVRRNCSYLLTAVLLVLVASASMPSITCRPHLMLPLLLLALVSLLEGSGRRPWLQWLVPLVFVLWANTHASFTVGLAIVGAWMLHRAVGSPERLADGIRLSVAGFVQGMLVLLGSLAACLVNPVGVGLLLYSLKYLPGGEYAFHAKVIQEWRPAPLGTLELAAATLILVGGGLVMLLRIRRVSLFGLLAAALMLMMGMRWGRAIMHSAVVMAWIAAPVISEWLREVSPTLLGWSVRSKMAPERLLAPALIVISLLGIVSIYRPVRAKAELNRNVHPPIAAVAWVEAHRPQGNMYNPYQWGGYLIHRLYPRYRVFIDGRVDMYGTQVFNDWMAIRDAKPNWEQIAAKYGVEWGIVEPRFPLARAVTGWGKWAAVYRDNQVLIFVRRDGPNAALVGGS